MHKRYTVKSAYPFLEQEITREKMPSLYQYSMLNCFSWRQVTMSNPSKSWWTCSNHQPVKKSNDDCEIILFMDDSQVWNHIYCLAIKHASLDSFLLKNEAVGDNFFQNPSHFTFHT